MSETATLGSGEVLPGVFPVSDPTPFGGSGASSGSASAEPAAAPAPESGLGADAGPPAGTGSEATAAGTSPGTDGAQPPAEGEQAAAGTGYRFGGREFKDQAAAEQHLVRLEKGHSALRKQQDALNKQLRTAVDTANAWYEFHSQHAAGAGTGRPGSATGDAEEPEKPAEPEKPWLDTIDWGFAEELAQEKGLKYALYWMAQNSEKHFTGLLDKKLSDALGPFQQDREQQTALGNVMGTLQQFRDARTESGEVLFPELGDGADPQSVKAVVRIWKSLPPEIAMDPRGTGWEYALLKFRQMNGGYAASPGAGARSGTAVAASAGALRASEAARAASSLAISGNGTPRPSPEGQQPSMQEQFRREMLAAEDPTLKSPDGRSLGFSRVA